MIGAVPLCLQQFQNKQSGNNKLSESLTKASALGRQTTRYYPKCFSLLSLGVGIESIML
jgi:hypothetical protein